MSGDAAMFGPAAMAVTQGIGAFNIFLPKFTDVRRNNPGDNPDFAADVRTGEIAACVVTMGVGCIATYFTASPEPALTALFICIVLVVLYESTLRATAPFEGKLMVIQDA